MRDTAKTQSTQTNTQISAAFASPRFKPRFRYCSLVRAAMNDPLARTLFFSYPELGIRQVRTPGPFE